MIIWSLCPEASGSSKTCRDVSVTNWTNRPCESNSALPLKMYTPPSFFFFGGAGTSFQKCCCLPPPSQKGNTITRILFSYFGTSVPPRKHPHLLVRINPPELALLHFCWSESAIFRVPCSVGAYVSMVQNNISSAKCKNSIVILQQQKRKVILQQNYTYFGRKWQQKKE